MRDIALLTLSQRIAEVIDHSSQIGTTGQFLLEPHEERLGIAAGLGRPIPLGKPADDGGFASLLALHQALPLTAKSLRRLRIQSRPLGLFESLLDLQHLLEQVHGWLRAGLVVCSCISPTLQPDHVREARKRIPERTIGPIDDRRTLERRRLLFLIGHLVEVRMILPRQGVETPLERIQIQLELPL